MCFWIFAKRRQSQKVAPKSPVAPVVDKVPADIIRVADVMKTYMDPKEVDGQMSAVRDFFEGKMSYAEMRMRSG